MGLKTFLFPYFRGLLTVFPSVFHNPGIATVTCLFAAVKTQRRLTLAKNKSLLHLLDVAHKGGGVLHCGGGKNFKSSNVLFCFKTRKLTRGKAKTQMINPENSL